MKLIPLRRNRNTRRSAASGRQWRLRLPALNWRGLGLSLAGVAVIVAAAGLLGLMLNQPIQRIVVSGRLQRVSAMDVEKIVRANLGGAGLVTVDLAQISGALRSLPWVESAAVQRGWPRALRIQITEQTAVARWNDNGLLNASGSLFLSEARFAPPELPQLTGPAGTEAEVTARYLAAQGRLTEVGMRLAALELDARGAWSLTLDNGVMVRLGRAQVDQRFERFMLAAAKLVSQRAADIAYVDMRYSNGFAVGWKGSAGRVATASPALDRNG
jgi:cell division protein FtsQ